MSLIARKLHQAKSKRDSELQAVIAKLDEAVEALDDAVQEEHLHPLYPIERLILQHEVRVDFDAGIDRLRQLIK